MFEQYCNTQTNTLNNLHHSKFFTEIELILAIIGLCTYLQENCTYFCEKSVLFKDQVSVSVRTRQWVKPMRRICYRTQN